MIHEILLAFDFGEKKIGVAIGNSLTRQARPLSIILEKTKIGRFLKIEKLLKEWEPYRIIIGLSLDSNGKEQLITHHCYRFARQIRARYGLNTELINEHGSSLEAQDSLNTNEMDDAVAASIILQRYFDSLSL